jgi:phage baseplate assembly protein W
MAYRPVRTIYSYLSSSSQPNGTALPWTPSDGQDGMWKMNYSPEDAERDNLLFWAQTNWGELPFRFRFGANIRKYIFDQVPQLRENILDNAKSQLAKYFAHLKILKIDVYTAEDDQNLSANQIRFYLQAQTKKEKTIEINQIIGVHS